MTLDESAVRSHKVSQLLSDLSGQHIDDSKLGPYAESFRDIYSDGYRQRYSEILDMLEDITSDIDAAVELGEGPEDCLEVVSSNLMVLRKFLSENIETYGESTYSGVFKLSDHVDIEIRRLRERDSMFHELFGTGDNIVALHKEAEKLGNELNSARMEIAETRRNSEKLQMQMVAILGIFAAIVMAFSGGLDILGGAISVSGESDLFRVTFIVLLCGIILFNIFAFLMYMILAIIDSPNRLYSDRYRGAKGSRAERITSWLNGFKGSRFVIAFNIVLMASLIIDLIAMTVVRR